jgi:hypothetical protein
MDESSAKRAIQVGNQVIDILDADGQPDQRVADAELRPLFGRDTGVRHDRRVIDETLNAPEAFRQRKHLAALEETPGVAEVALDKEGDDGAETRHLPVRELMLRV